MANLHTSPTILLTGATGFLGFHILQTALKENYRVNIIVRSSKKADILRNNPILQSLQKQSYYTFTIIPDLGAPGALDAAAATSDYIIHTAAPLPWGPGLSVNSDLEAELLRPAVDSIVQVLETAKRTPQIKRVVYTSSAVALIPIDINFGLAPPEKVYTSDDRADAPKPPYNDMLTAYTASKIVALEAAEAWMRKNSGAIAFDLVTIAPAYIIGSNGLIDSREELESNTSNQRWFRILKGERFEVPLAAGSTSVEDCASMHVLALDKKRVEGNQVVGLVAGMDWDDIVVSAERMFPEAVKKGLIKHGGGGPSKTIEFDNHRAEEILGGAYRGVDGMVESLVGQWVQIA